MIDIQPKTVGIADIEATKLLIRPLIYSTTDTSCRVYWEVYSDDDKPLINGYVDLTPEEYDNWGANNTDLENIILDKLNLVRL